MRRFRGDVEAPGTSICPEHMNRSRDAGYGDRWCRFLGWFEIGMDGFYKSHYNAGWCFAECDLARLQMTKQERAEELWEMKLGPREFWPATLRKGQRLADRMAREGVDFN